MIVKCQGLKDVDDIPDLRTKIIVMIVQVPGSHLLGFLEDITTMYNYVQLFEAIFEYRFVTDQQIQKSDSTKRALDKKDFNFSNTEK